jgi:hypothetical protein
MDIAISGACPARVVIILALMLWFDAMFLRVKWINSAFAKLQEMYMKSCDYPSIPTLTLLSPLSSLIPTSQNNIEDIS